ncbi:MAG: ATP-binding protein [Chitinophagales bacterium]|nr:ATP-binding protein [Chitinophagales bacterium]
MRKLKNPFLLTGFYGVKYFCNRKKELKELESCISNERNIVLYSWRRMGKTALIKYFLSKQKRSKKAEYIYVDLLGSRNMKSAVQLIAQAVYEEFGKTSSGLSASLKRLLGVIGVGLSFDPVSGTPTLQLSYKQPSDAKKSLNAIGEFLRDRKKTIVVALDEFQQVAEFEDENGEALFRTWVQDFPSIRFIFSGSHRHMMVSMFTEKNRPFYHSSRLIPLNPIEKNDYKKFILKHFNDADKSIQESEIDNIYGWSRQQTYCIQLVCNRLFGMFDKVNPADLKKVFNDLIQEEAPLFASYSKLLSSTQWNVLRAVASEEPLTSYLSADFIRKYDLGATSSVSTALNALMKKEIVIEDNGNYLVHDVLLARWLQSLQ